VVAHMRARLRRMWPDERGQSLVEMALVLPLLFLLVAGIIDFGRAFNNHIIIINAAREGARYGSRYPIHDEGIILAVSREAAESGVLLDGSNVGIDPEPPAVALAGDPIVVTVTYQFDTILGGIVGADSLTLTSSAEMIVF